MPDFSTNEFERERVILHCDMNNFYASVECLLDPNLRGHPVAVCSSVEDRHGIVLAKNYEAKAFGITTTETVWQAKRKCPELIIVSPHHELYKKLSRRARDIYARYTDQIEPYGLDECWLDVTGSGCMGNGLEIAEAIRQAVKTELGLTISVGVSFNKVFAKLGSDLKKPDAVTCISPETFREQIWGLKASEMIGIGRAAEKVLNSYGIRTIGELATASDALLENRLGKSGLVLKQYANGLDRSEVRHMDYRPPVKSIGHGITTAHDLKSNAEVWGVILALVQEIGTKLRKHGKKAGGISISVRNCKLRIREWQSGLEVPTHSPLKLAKAAYALFCKGYAWEQPARSVTVRVINLVEADSPVQISAFSEPAQIEKEEHLEDAVEQIRARFGMTAICSATLLQNTKAQMKRIG